MLAQWQLVRTMHSIKMIILLSCVCDCFFLHCNWNEGICNMCSILCLCLCAEINETRPWMHILVVVAKFLNSCRNTDIYKIMEFMFDFRTKYIELRSKNWSNKKQNYETLPRNIFVNAHKRNPTERTHIRTKKTIRQKMIVVKTKSQTENAF